jgi:hypothetical protein
MRPKINHDYGLRDAFPRRGLKTLMAKLKARACSRLSPAEMSACAAN